MNGMSAQDIAPLVLKFVPTRCANNRTVQEALQDHRWVADVRGNLSAQGLLQCLALLTMTVCTIFRDVTSPDAFVWPWSSAGIYSASSAYRLMTQGPTRMSGAMNIWRSWAPLKCKIFCWLALQHRLWTSDRRARHGLQDNPSPFYTCLQDEDNMEHITTQCVYTRKVWFECFRKLNIHLPSPLADNTLETWWTDTRLLCARKDRERLRQPCHSDHLELVEAS